jgi:hypothetical protein
MNPIKIILPVAFIVSIVYALMFTMDSPFFLEDNFKEYVIEHQSEIYRTDSSHFKIYNLDSEKTKYWTDVTIKLRSDSSYYMLFWGDRDSWLWTFNKDVSISADISYDTYKSKNVDLDRKILKALYDCKQNF